MAFMDTKTGKLSLLLWVVSFMTAMTVGAFVGGWLGLFVGIVSFIAILIILSLVFATARFAIVAKRLSIKK